MKVLVDTCIWSLALRRDRPCESAVVLELRELIPELRVQLIGPVRQELLSGVKRKNQFQQLKSYLQAFPDLILETEDYETAAEFYTLCRKKGIQGSNTDFLLCAVAIRRGIPIFTVDKDFCLFSDLLPVALHSSRYSADN